MVFNDTKRLMLFSDREVHTLLVKEDITNKGYPLSQLLLGDKGYPLSQLLLAVL